MFKLYSTSAVFVDDNIKRWSASEEDSRSTCLFGSELTGNKNMIFLFKAGSAGEEFPTTCEDLAGFWDMVSIQVEDVNNSLQEIDALRSNGWKEVITSPYQLKI